MEGEEEAPSAAPAVCSTGDNGGKYKCGVCGKLKRGHMCTAVAATVEG